MFVAERVAQCAAVQFDVSLSCRGEPQLVPSLVQDRALGARTVYGRRKANRALVFFWLAVKAMICHSLQDVETHFMNDLCNLRHFYVVLHVQTGGIGSSLGCEEVCAVLFIR